MSGRGHRYPTRILLGDALAISGMAVAGFARLADGIDYQDDRARGDALATGMFVASFAAYLGVPFAIHLRHDNPRGAVRSVLARTALPLLGGTLADVAPPHRNGASETNAVPVSIAGGVAAAMVLDWAVFAWTDGVAAAPFVSPGHEGGLQVGLAGQF